MLRLAASHDFADILKAKQGGALGYICKPVQPDAFADMVADILTDRDLVWMDA